MRGFDESWLRDYQMRQKQEPQKFPVATAPPKISLSTDEQAGDIVFKLSKPLLLPNAKNKLHWTDKSRLIHEMSDEVARAILKMPPQPLQKVSIVALRYGLKNPDWDNLQSSLKSLLDVLQPRSDRHPYGLGIIAGDDPAHLVAEAVGVQVKSKAEQKTLVRIRDLSAKP